MALGIRRVRFLKTGNLGQKIGYILRNWLKAIPNVHQNFVKIFLYIVIRILGQIRVKFGFTLRGFLWHDIM
jgi:hypothetical protein